MAKKSSLYLERFKVVDETHEYYTIISLTDTIEFIYRIHKKKMIDKELWQRWENYAKGMMTVPKFNNVLNTTQKFHTPDFVNFMDISCKFYNKSNMNDVFSSYYKKKLSLVI